MAAAGDLKVAKRFGPYKLLNKVGAGGMGSVYKAVHAETDEIVALKLATRAVADNTILSQRFDNEFKIASQLQHPNLVRALGHGVEKDIPYLVMEFVAGQSLDEKLKAEGPLSIERALNIFTQIANVTTFIHGHHLIHRDIKPGNILIGPGDEAKLADLGLIKDLDSSSILTNSGTGLGTFEYAAPEQFDDAKHVDCRCDIYAMAASLYVALTGKYPFGPGSGMRTLLHKLEHQFTPVAQLIEGVSPALDQVIIRSLHPDPAKRPASSAAFLEAMRSTKTPRSLLQPKPLPKVGATVQARGRRSLSSPRAKMPVLAPANRERRGGARHATKISTTLGVLNSGGQEGWPVQIMDISPGGLCLQIPRRFEPNTLLNVFLPGESGGKTTPHLIRTCWTKKLADNTWLIGCLFVNPLAIEELDRFLIDELCKTDMLKGKRR